MADWLIANGFSDPMADRRGTYTKSGHLLREEGGIVASCILRFRSIGLRETETPEAGDVALVMAPFAVRCGKPVLCPTGAICVSDARRAVVTRDSGLVIADLATVKVWTFDA